jgi:hypothetical protein
LAGEDVAWGATFWPEVDVMTVESGLASPEAARAVPVIAESSLEPDLWLNEDRSVEDDDVVDTEGGEG